MSILVENCGHVRIFTINRPEARNALDIEASRELARRFVDFRDDADAWVAIITGAGERSFCAGGDLKKIGAYYASLTPIERRNRGETEPGIGGITRNLAIFKPIIAAINGYCLAGGLEIALACDLRVAEEHAEFGLTEAKWGIIPGAGGTQRLPRLIGMERALDLMMTARRMPADEALGCGLISRLVPRGQALETALALADQISRNAPLAVRALKEAAMRGVDMALDDGLRLEQFLAEPLRQSEDAKEGPRAFAAGEQPKFKGK